MGAQLGQALGVDTEVVARAAAFLCYQARGLEHLQVLGHRRAADRQVRGQIADRRRPLAQQVQHGLARGIGKGSQQLLSVSHD